MFLKAENVDVRNRRTSLSELNQRLIFTLINLSTQKPKSFWVKKPDSSKGTVLHRLQANEQAINVMPSLAFAVTCDLLRSA